MLCFLVLANLARSDRKARFPFNDVVRNQSEKGSKCKSIVNSSASLNIIYMMLT